MTLREAAQQALSAIEDSGHKADLVAAASALRAALEQPEPEPVAKVEPMTAGGNAGIATRIVEIDDPLRERLRPGQLLYTAPSEPDYRAMYLKVRDELAALQQRAPLTNAEINKEAVKAGFTTGLIVTDGGAFGRFVRAIEAAHGIGEAK